MKHFKTIVATVMMALILPLLAVTADAADAVGFHAAVSASDAKPGEQVEVVVSLTGYTAAAAEADAVRGLQVDITGVDPDVLQVVQYTSLIEDTTAESNTASYNAANKRVRLAYVQTSGTLPAPCEDVFKVVFQVNSDVTGSIMLPVTVKMQTVTQQVTLTGSCTINWQGGPGEGQEATPSIALSQSYLNLTLGEKTQITADVQPTRLEGAVRWKVEPEENSVISVDDNGLVTARGAGTAYVIASVPWENGELTARCRVDVTENAKVEGIRLSTQTLTTELYKTDYASFEILLKLPQNDSPMAAVYSLRGQNTGIAMESARFTDETVAKLFDIRVLDDRSVLVVPTEYAVENPDAVESKYVSTVTVMAQGQGYESEALTLSVKKTEPKLKASVPAFNSFYSGQSQTISVTGGTVRTICADESKNTEKTSAIPAWLTLRDGALTLTEDAPLKNVSGKAYILVETEEWRIPVALTLSVKNTYKAPELKLSASSVTMSAQADLSSGVELKLLCKNKKDTLPDLGVTALGVSGDSGYVIENFSAEDGTFILKAKEGFQPGKLTLWVSFADTEVSVPLTLTVKTTPVKLKLSKTSVSLNSAVADSAVITVTATPADYMLNLTEDNLRLTDNRGNALADPEVLDISASGNQIRIVVNENTPEKASYKLTVEVGGTKVTMTVKVISAVPTVTYKAAGALDQSFPDQAVKITPSFKNYNGGFTIEAMTAESSKHEDVTAQFRTTETDGMISVTCGKTVPAGSYNLNLTLKLADGSTVENTVKVTVKRTAVKLKLGTGSLSLNKRIDGRGAVKVTCTTRGYAFTEPVWQIMDKSGKTPADGMLDIGYVDGELTVAVNDRTAYGATYKVLVKADEYAPATTLTVTIPTEAKSDVTATLKATGRIDVVRDGSVVTVTPAYKNATALTPWQEELFIYSSEDGYSEPVKDLFCIEPNGSGGYTITKAEGAVLDHSSKYKVKLVSTYQDVNVETALVSFSVSMGSARLTTQFSDTTLFAKDVHDRALVWFESQDLTLNGISRLAIRDAKYRDMFEVIDYGDGLFAIGYRDNTVHPSLIATKSTTSVTLNLDVFLEGNQTSKANTTAKLKLTIVR